jgi:osmotically-inducible protein OsmY
MRRTEQNRDVNSNRQGRQSAWREVDDSQNYSSRNRYGSDRSNDDREEDRFMGNSYASNGDYSVDGVRFGREDDSRSRFSEGREANRARFADSSMSRQDWGGTDRSNFASSGRFDSDRAYNMGGSERFSQDERGMTSHFGKGPKGYRRSDDRIREDVCEALAHSHAVDASDVDVMVKDGLVTLTGTVDSRSAKREAESCVEHLSGVEDVRNELSVKREGFLSNLTSSSDKSMSKQ